MKDRFAELREAMVREQIEYRGIRNERLLAVLRALPRHQFVPPSEIDCAYEDHPLPIGFGQTISQPYIAALMTQLLQLEGTENVLEIGSGSGYQAAILAHLAHQVHTIERIPQLSEQARKILLQLGLKNVQVHTGDGSLGYLPQAPYNAILITAAAPDTPRALLDQLAPQGRLVIPVGKPGAQVLQRWVRINDRFEYEDLLPVVFVPLIGQAGWPAAT